MQQLLEFDADAEARKELSGVLGKSVRRIQRLTQQMNFLSRDWDGKDGETVKITSILESAYAEAQNFNPGANPGTRAPRFDLDRNNAAMITGDTKALRHAFSEIILNALQANPENPTVTVRIQQGKDEKLSVEVQDSGPGFPSDLADEIGVPFHSTRSVGLGLGLTVTRKIIENHLGTLEIPATGVKGPGIVRVTLPN
jgi:signal transduction histidine kinase